MEEGRDDDGAPRGSREHRSATHVAELRRAELELVELAAIDDVIELRLEPRIGAQHLHVIEEVPMAEDTGAARDDQAGNGV